MLPTPRSGFSCFMAEGNGGPFTKTPNYFYDVVMPTITSLSELKVTELIIRHTIGFHREEKELSISLIMELTGLSKQAAIDGTERALMRGTVTRRPYGQGFKYRVQLVNHLDYQNATSQQFSTAPVNYLDTASQGIRQEGVNNLDTWKDTLKETSYKENIKIDTVNFSNSKLRI